MIVIDKEKIRDLEKQAQRWSVEQMEILKKRQKEYNDMQISMTRKEAVQKIYELSTSLKSDEIVRVLEALGFKFKEPEPVNVNRERFKAAMRKYGYAEGGCGFHDALAAYDSIYT